LNHAFALPDGFIRMVSPLLGGELSDFLQSYENAPQRALLPSPRRPLDCSRWCEGSCVPWERAARYLTPGASPGAHPLHWAGAFYLQEPSAMTAVSALSPQAGDRVLDLCAAPGGKTVQIAMRLQGKGLLVSNDPVPSRALVLSGNVERMGIRNVVVSSEQPERLAMKFEAFFDKVLVDAPCSGEGMFRKDPRVMAQWQEGLPEKLSGQQLRILLQAAAMLKPGGQMVYSTCTFNRIENEGVIEDFLKARNNFSLTPFALEGLPPARFGMLRLWPHHVRGEGHFVALLRKKPAARDAAAQPAKLLMDLSGDEKKQLDFVNSLIPDWVTTQVIADGFLGSAAVLLPDGCPDLAGLRVLRLGLHVAERVGKTWRPAHALALSAQPRRVINTDEAGAERYRAGEPMKTDENISGFTALALEGWPLGWGKAVAGAFKNHYPKGLRRFSSPEEDS